MKIRQKESIKGLSVVIPMVLYYLLFTIVPLGMMVGYSMTNYNVIKNQKDFIGLKNFVNMFNLKDYPEYFTSIGITILIAVLVVAVGMFLGFVLALMMTKVLRCKSLFRILWYIPALLPMAVVSRFLTTLLGSNGSLNRLFELFGGSGVIDWYASTFWMYFWIIAIITWKGLGSTALLFVAGINGVSKDVYEAADIDGATGLTKVFRITIPMIRPMLGFILITGFIGAFNLFEPVMLISGGGPEETTKVIMYRIYDEAFKNNNLGFASAISLVVFVVVLLLTFINIKISDDSILKMEDK